MPSHKSTASRSKTYDTIPTRMMSSATSISSSDYNSSYNVSYTPTQRTHRLDYVTPYGSMRDIYDERDSLFDQRLDFLNQQIVDTHSTKTSYIQMDKFLVYIALEYILNGNVDQILLKTIYEVLDKHNSAMINGECLIKYLQKNKNNFMDFMHLHNEISNFCQWKLIKIFSLFKAQRQITQKYADLETKYNKLKQRKQQKQTKINEMKQQIKAFRANKQNKKVQIAISREQTMENPKCRELNHLTIHSSKTTKTQKTKIKHSDDKNKKISRRKVAAKTKTKTETLSTWRQYTDRLIYIKQRYPNEYIDRNKGWKKWKNLLNDTEKNGKIDGSAVCNIWKFIDFARMSCGMYGNYLWICEGDRKWTKKYVVLMDFNLFVFDKRVEIKNIAQTLCLKHSLLSIASIVNVYASKENCVEIVLELNENKNIHFRCEEAESRKNWIDEIIYHSKCVQDLLKIPHIKLKAADPDKNIWLPLPIGYDTA